MTVVFSLKELAEKFSRTDTQIRRVIRALSIKPHSRSIGAVFYTAEDSLLIAQNLFYCSNDDDLPF